MDTSAALRPVCRTEISFCGMLFFILIYRLLSLSLSLSPGLWDDRFVLYRALRTIYVGGVEGYGLRASDTCWKEIGVLITRLDSWRFVSFSFIKYFKVLNPPKWYVYVPDPRKLK